MSNVKEDLQKLGFSPANKIKVAKKPNFAPVEEIVGGKRISNSQGDVILVEKLYPYDELYGNLRLTKPSDPRNIFRFTSTEAVSKEPARLLFIDTETTGLTGGTGTFPFLIGFGYFDPDGFRVSQLLIDSPNHEFAQLMEFDHLIDGFETTVTFNGKSFDLPLLRTRYRMHRLPYPLELYSHIDLLHLSRKIWKIRLVDRSLKELESNILGVKRNADEVPGWMIPQVYFDFLRSGDGLELKGVVYHNELDIVSMAALYQEINALLADSEIDQRQCLDIYSLAVMNMQIGDFPKALSLFEHSVEAKELPLYLEIDVHQKMAEMYKKLKIWDLAVEHWLISSQFGSIDACIELAKYYEHRAASKETALTWAKLARDTLSNSPLSRYKKHQLLRELAKRIDRLNGG